MSGDYSRNSFEPQRNFSAVRMQQGRVALDADWNEQGAIIERRARAQTVDLLGRRGVPRETADGFKVSIVTQGGRRMLKIGRGRMYVDGLLAENHGATPFTFDLAEPLAEGGTIGVLGEAIGQTIDYDQQPYWPTPDALASGDGPHLVYLDVWQREVTSIEEPALLEKALNGVDTTTRLQTVWQVRLLPNVTGGGGSLQLALAALTERTRPSAGRLTTEVDPTSLATDPCLIAMSGGYRGLENQLYRVEVHEGGKAGTATFKWSRDNATIVTTLTEIISGTTVRVASTGRDSVLNFKRGHWIELTDDRREFAQRAGAMLKIQDVDYENQRITFASAIPADLIPTGVMTDILAARRTRMRRWDQAGIVRDAAGAVVIDLDAAAAPGTIPVPAAANRLITLESGIRVAFDVEPADGLFRVGDFWTFAARAIDASAEKLDRAPSGVAHHYSPLALLRFPDEVLDLRAPLNPVVGSTQVLSVLHVDPIGRSRPLETGTELPASQFAEGFDILVPQKLDPDAVNDASVFVVSDIPFRAPGGPASGDAGAIVGYQQVVLSGDVSLRNDGVVDWRPLPQTATFLSDLLRRDVPRVRTVPFEREFQVFDYSGPASRWQLGPGNLVLQTAKNAGTRPDSTPGQSVMPTTAINRYVLKENAQYVGTTIETPNNGTAGIVYNWISEQEFSVFFCVHEATGGFSGFRSDVELFHADIRDGQILESSIRRVTVSRGQSVPVRISLDIKRASDGLHFGHSTALSGAPTSSSTNLEELFQRGRTFVKGSRLGVLTRGTGNARFTRLQVVYGNDPLVTLIPAGVASRILSRLVVKRSLLDASPRASAGSVFSSPVPEPDFETWFWLLPSLPRYYTYRYAGPLGFVGIGAERLIAEGGIA
ncbi:hypothetical protein ACVWYQ_006407 [Bradyrhizobium sp. USDA 3397]